jgi:hypothetical protein
MLTFFTTPKPFAGHIAVIQRNALMSWKRLAPGTEILLIGPEPGAAEIARELGLIHLPNVRRNEHGTKYLASIFGQAQHFAHHDLLCYVNCDILLTSDFFPSLRTVSAAHQQFLLAGRRRDLDIRDPLAFANPEWEASLRARVQREGRLRPPQWIDYFVFPRGLYAESMPEFVIGRPGWDNWLLWHARNTGVPLVDATDSVLAVHQNHDYSYHPQGETGVWEGEEARRNYSLLGGWRRLCTLESATYRLSPRGLRRSHGHFRTLARRATGEFVRSTWFAMLGATRPLRHRLGLRRKEAPRSA